MARGGAAVLAATVAAASLGVFLAYLTRPLPPSLPPPPPLGLAKAAFVDLAGWRQDDHGAALTAFRRSCRVLQRSTQRKLAASGIGGLRADWQQVCAQAPEGADNALARAFFERFFQPVAVLGAGGPSGLITGYYEPSLRGSRKQSARYRFPLYRRPKDMIRVDAGVFKTSLKGQRLIGRIDGDRLKPYFDRAAIDAGALDGKGLELVWVDDAVDAFFLHIQGSGRVALRDGGEMRVGFAGKNGRRYFAVGRELIRRGAVSLEDMSMQAIRAWLAAHPDEAAALMALNPSYVFFRELKGPGPRGALGIALSPGRSLAVDRKLLPLGAPLWLDTTLPAALGAAAAAYRRLMVAQDTGGAILGAVRGDVFFGHGQEAEAVAGRMRQSGRIYLLLPKPLAARLP